MMQEERYCPSCSTPLEIRDTQGSRRPVCPSCGRVIYYDPKLAATVVVEREDKVLMVRRLTQPGFGLWSLPGGYVDRGEVVEHAAAREVVEETGLHVDITGLVGLFSEDGHPVVVAAFDSRNTIGEAIAGPEVSELGFFQLDALPPLAFPRDVEILKAWVGLRNGGGDQARF
ncbi:MAG: NUDIX hydrolase [Chloroflexi bacterium]|nr:NUDIX hydrolase [Chloroflexota bacterium]